MFSPGTPGNVSALEIIIFRVLFSYSFREGNPGWFSNDCILGCLGGGTTTTPNVPNRCQKPRLGMQLGLTEGLFLWGCGALVFFFGMFWWDFIWSNFIATSHDPGLQKIVFRKGNILISGNWWGEILFHLDRFIETLRKQQKIAGGKNGEAAFGGDLLSHEKFHVTTVYHTYIDPTKKTTNQCTVNMRQSPWIPHGGFVYSSVGVICLCDRDFFWIFFSWNC